MFNNSLHNNGFTLVEIMIAIFVLSIGLLGLASLQTLSVRNNTSAYHRTIATQMAYDMADRMRANPVGFAANDYDNPTAVKNTNCEAVAGCTPAQMAAHDMYEWSAAAADGSLPKVLPSGSGTVCLDETPDVGTSAAPDCDTSGGTPAIHVIKIWWVDDRAGTEVGIMLPVVM